MESFKYVLLGGGTSCAYAAVSIRERDPEGALAIVGADSEPPYDRPPLSKAFLMRDDFQVADAHSKDESFYSEKNIHLLKGVRVRSLNRSAQRVLLDDGREISYEHLLFALGSKPRELPVPGGEKAMLLRTASDAVRIRERARGAKSAVVIGGGFIGCEVSASFLQRGIEVSLVERAPNLWTPVPSEPARQAVRKELEKAGCKVLTSCTVQELRGESPIEVLLSSGEVLRGDFVVAGIGVTPNVEVAQEAGLKVGSWGVLADENLRTSDARVWVSGDVAEFPDGVMGSLYHAEHHLHAKWTGEHAGAGMAGEVQPYRRVPYFFSDVGALSMIWRGYPEKASTSFVFGDVSEPAFTEVFLSGDNRVVGMVDLRHDYSVQEPLSDLFEKLILAQADVSPYLQDFKRSSFDVLALRELIGG